MFFEILQGVGTAGRMGRAGFDKKRAWRLPSTAAFLKGGKRT